MFGGHRHRRPSHRNIRPEELLTTRWQRRDDREPVRRRTRRTSRRTEWPRRTKASRSLLRQAQRNGKRGYARITPARRVFFSGSRRRTQRARSRTRLRSMPHFAGDGSTARSGRSTTLPGCSDSRLERRRARGRRSTAARPRRSSQADGCRHQVSLRSSAPNVMAGGPARMTVQRRRPCRTTSPRRSSAIAGPAHSSRRWMLRIAMRSSTGWRLPGGQKRARKGLPHSWRCAPRTRRFIQSARRSRARRLVTRRGGPGSGAESSASGRMSY